MLAHSVSYEDRSGAKLQLSSSVSFVPEIITLVGAAVMCLWYANPSDQLPAESTTRCETSDRMKGTA